MLVPSLLFTPCSRIASRRYLELNKDELTGAVQHADIESSLADHVFVLPKLLWPKPPGKARWKTRVKNNNERIALAQQGKWKTLLETEHEAPAPPHLRAYP